MSLNLRGSGNPLTQNQVDSNFTFLYNRDITGSTVSGTTLLLYKQDGTVLATQLPSNSGGTGIDSFVTGFTFTNNNTLTISRNQGLSDLPITINNLTLTGLTVNGSISASTYLGISQSTPGAPINSIQFNGGNNVFSGSSSFTFTPSITGTNLVSLNGNIQITGGSVSLQTSTLNGIYYILNNRAGASFADYNSTVETGTNSITTDIFTIGRTFDITRSYIRNSLLLRADTVTNGINSGVPTKIFNFIVSQNSNSQFEWHYNTTDILTSSTAKMILSANTGNLFTSGSYSTTALTLRNTPTLNNSNTQILVRNSTTGNVEYRDASTISGGTGIDTFTTGFTYSNNNLTISRNQGQPALTVTINNFTGLTINGAISATTYLNLPPFTGNTSASCITDLYVSNIYGCSPITVHDSIKSVGSTVSGSNSFAFGEMVTATGPWSMASGRLTQSTAMGSNAEGSSTLASGTYSHAEGLSTSATTTGSHAEGRNTQVTGQYSHAEGSFTKVLGSSSHAEGDNTQVIGDFSHAEGSGTTVTGNYSHAEGVGTTVTGNYSHAEGDRSSVIGNYSHAEGARTSAESDASHAEGSNTTAIGEASHTEGIGTSTIGVASHAEGIATTASGNYSHAEGSNTTAIGEASHTEGYNIQAIGDYSHAEGENTYSGAYAYLVSGTSGNNIVLNPSYGDVTADFGSNTIFTYGGFGTGSEVLNFSSVSYDNITSATTVTVSNIGLTTPYCILPNPLETGIFAPTNADLRIGRSSHAEGNITQTIGIYSHAEGDITQAIGGASHAEGYYTQAIGDYSHAEGGNTQAIGNYSHAEGGNTQSIGDYSHSQGFNTIANGDYSFASGSGSTASGIASFIHSSRSVVTGDRSVVLGGVGITGTSNNTVYVPDFVIKKSAVVPTGSTHSVGEAGSITWDNGFFYVRNTTGWTRTTLSNF